MGEGRGPGGRDRKPRPGRSGEDFPPAGENVPVLKRTAATLQGLCERIDPFEGPSPEDRDILSGLGPFDCSDPHVLTKQLLTATEDTLQRIRELESQAGG